VDPSSIVNLGLGAQQIIETALRLVNRNTANFEKVRDEVFRRWVADLQVLVDELLKESEALRDRVSDLVEDPEFCRVQINYGFEATREAIDERRGFLAYAAAGSYQTQLPIVRMARVERTIRQLESDDVRMLKKVSDALEERLNQLRADQERLGSTSEQRQAQTASQMMNVIFNEVSSTSSGQSLLASGCLFTFSPPVWDAVIEVKLTELGSEVLKVMDLFLRATSSQIAS